MTVASTNKSYRSEKVAPDGGWGYMIGVGIALPFVNIHNWSILLFVLKSQIIHLIQGMFLGLVRILWIDIQ